MKVQGRPRKQEDKKYKIFTFSATPELKEILIFLRKKKINKSKICADAIKKVYKKVSKD